MAGFAAGWRRGSMGAWLEVGLAGRFSPGAWPRGPAAGFQPPSAVVISARPVLHKAGVLRCLRRKMATCMRWSVSLWRDLGGVSHCRNLSPGGTGWRLVSAALCGWGRYFVAGRLWLMKHIREEEVACWRDD